MSITRRMTVVFRVTAGPRRGFGHLARCRALARTLGVRPLVSMRADQATCRAAVRAGVTLVPGGLRALDRLRPALVVVDDPVRRHAGTWVRGARRRGVPVAAICDAGLGRVDADLVIDGSVRAARPRRRSHLWGPRFAVLDPRVPGLRARRRARARRILVAVGGGAHVFTAVPALARALAARLPGAEIRVAPGFTGHGPAPVLPAGRWIAPARLAPALAAADLAIVGGGLTAYEACALGVPAVAVAVAPGQRPTIRALARRGAVVDGGIWASGRSDRLGALAARLLDAPGVRRRMARAGRGLVDGLGARRIAAALSRLAAGGRHA